MAVNAALIATVSPSTTAAVSVAVVPIVAIDASVAAVSVATVAAVVVAALSIVTNATTDFAADVTASDAIFKSAGVSDASMPPATSFASAEPFSNHPTTSTSALMTGRAAQTTSVRIGTRP